MQCSSIAIQRPPFAGWGERKRSSLSRALFVQKSSRGLSLTFTMVRKVVVYRFLSFLPPNRSLRQWNCAARVSYGMFITVPVTLVANFQLLLWHLLALVISSPWYELGTNFYLPFCHGPISWYQWIMNAFRSGFQIGQRYTAPGHAISVVFGLLS